MFLAAGCSSGENVTGKAIAADPDIYEDAAAAKQKAKNETVESQIEPQAEQVIQIKTGEQYYDEIANDKPAKEIRNDKEFKFSPESIVSTQNNISLSLDKIKHEVKNEYWGKITGITLTVLNSGSMAFRPKALVLLYDEKDFKEEWLKPKAEIEFDIEKIYPGEHASIEAIVNIAFDEMALVKHFKLIIVDAADIGNKPLVVVEKEFNPLLG
ncbi:hypothetical protein HYV80_02475 [Candidatus Woesearchaeota archaeon]|nr:hypothetical protein [Candidatus Woesearchaeota archaeon]